MEEARHKTTSRDLEADGARFFLGNLRRAASFWTARRARLLRYLRRRGGEGVVQLGEFGRVAPRRRDVELSQLLDERSARRGPLAQLRARLGERLAARARVDLEAVRAPFRALGPLAQLRNLIRVLP